MTRTVLQIVQDACTKIGIEQVTELFSSTERTHVELRQALIEAADKIVRAHDWQALKTLVNHTGDGTTTEFAKASDFLRMPKDGQIWSTKWEAPLEHIDPETWLNLDIREFDLVYGTWTLFGDNFVYKPALASDETARFFYVSRNKCADSLGTAKETFTADDDTFRLDDRVLELVFIWTWRQQKQLDYAEDMATAEIALSRAISDDKGARILVQASRPNYRAKTAYPWKITP
jgi:hypothetical protein